MTAETPTPKLHAKMFLGEHTDNYAQNLIPMAATAARYLRTHPQAKVGIIIEGVDMSPIIEGITFAYIGEGELVGNAVIRAIYDIYADPNQISWEDFLEQTNTSSGFNQTKLSILNRLSKGFPGRIVPIFEPPTSADPNKFTTDTASAYDSACAGQFEEGLKTIRETLSSSTKRVTDDREIALTDKVAQMTKLDPAIELIVGHFGAAHTGLVKRLRRLGIPTEQSVLGRNGKIVYEPLVALLRFDQQRPARLAGWNTQAAHLQAFLANTVIEIGGKIMTKQLGITSQEVIQKVLTAFREFLPITPLDHVSSAQRRHFEEQGIATPLSETIPPAMQISLDHFRSNMAAMFKELSESGLGIGKFPQDKKEVISLLLSEKYKDFLNDFENNYLTSFGDQIVQEEISEIAEKVMHRIAFIHAANRFFHLGLTV